MSLCRNNLMDMYLMLYLLENHAYFDLVDIFYRNFTQSTTKRRSCHFCAHTNKSRCRVGKWPLYRHIFKIFFSYSHVATKSYQVYSEIIYIFYYWYYHQPRIVNTIYNMLCVNVCIHSKVQLMIVRSHFHQSQSR